MDSDIEVAFALPAVKPPRPRRSRQRWKVAAFIAAFVVVSVGGGLGMGAIFGPAPVTIAGHLLLSDATMHNAGTVCTGQGGFSDIRRGAQVVITDETGTTLALAELGQGQPTGTNVCSFPFAAGDLYEHPFYGVEIANRVKVQFSHDQVAGPITLTLGD